MIQIKNLRKFYGKSRGIVDISFDVKKGEIFGFIGPNGAGKSTTIRILTGLLSNDAGNASIDGISVPHDIDKIKERIGYLPSEVNLYGDMKVVEFLSYNRKFYSNVDISYEKELIEMLDIDITKKFKELSFGNKKKIGILQAIVHKPDYLILDEPTNGLDPLMQHKFYTILEKERERGVAILFSSHILSEVEKVCDRFAVIKEGLIVNQSTMEDFSKNSKKIVTVYGLKNPELLKQFELTEQYDKEWIYNIKFEDIHEFMKLAFEAGMKDIELRKPSLEEAFMEYYKS